MEIKIYKSAKKLEFWEGSLLHKTYPIAIGKTEVGHKEKEGDMKTPEGIYRVCLKNPHSDYHLSFVINYPNNRDAKIGLEKGLISTDEYAAICKANDNLQMPPQKTALGGEICIHGELEKKNWSQGCIRLFNRDMDELYPKVCVNTPVTIFS